MVSLYRNILRSGAGRVKTCVCWHMTPCSLIFTDVSEKSGDSIFNMAPLCAVHCMKM
jgi:hypothetical protein